MSFNKSLNGISKLVCGFNNGITKIYALNFDNFWQLKIISYTDIHEDRILTMNFEERDDQENLIIASADGTLGIYKI